MAVNKGDEILFVVDNNGKCNYDLCRLNLVIDFAKEGEEYTDTYDRVKNFAKTDKYGSAWSYHLVNFKVPEATNDVNPLKVITYGGLAGCGGFANVDSFVLALVIICASVAVIFVKKIKGKTK